MGKICDICGYEDETELGTVVVICKDTIARCSLCQNQKRYGKRWVDDNDNAPVIDSGGDTDVKATWPIEKVIWVDTLSDSDKPHNIR